ncbi:MAG: hypothetical protein JXO51_10620 [Candidatus Aminicenantes bacterium]|nr:hypothetical protein [Candidatus Aminicenantes bacterium]
MKDEELDKFVSRTLEKAEEEVPAALRDGVRRQAAAAAAPPRPWRRLAFWGSLAAAAFLLAVLFLPPLFPPRVPERKIRRIRTEFTIPDKNIRIVWVQRDDFRLPEAGG